MYLELLHACQFAPGHADLVLARGRRRDPRPVLGVLAKARHVLGQAAHGPYHEQVQAEKHQRRREERNTEGKAQNTVPITDCQGPEFGFVEHDLDQDVRIVGRGPDHAQDSGAIAQHGSHGAAN